MNGLRISRRHALQGAGLLGLVGTLGGPVAAFADDDGDETLVRWDIITIDFVNHTLSAGGHASASAQDGSTITLTGSGTFRPEAPDRVTGGGTWSATGSVAGSGTYVVKGLVSFVRAPGGAPPLTDLIGKPADQSAGLAFLRIAYSNGMRGVLVVSCQIPGNPIANPPTPPAPKSIFEGIRTSMGFVDFWDGDDPKPGVNGNRTNFHVTRDS